MRSLKAGLTYFALVFGTGFVLGAIRVPLLVPRLGVRVAELIEAPFMLAAILFAARFVVRRFALPPTAAPRLATGILALALLLAAEVTLGVVLFGRSVTESLGSGDPVSGTVYRLLLVFFALWPWLLARAARR